MRYNYKNDLDAFFSILAKPGGTRIKGKTMNQVGDSLTKLNNGKDSVISTYFVDMEGGYHREDDFNISQLNVLHKLIEKGNKYPFVCYPDIPADVMRILVYYADTHPDALNRLSLWKLARSGITDRKIMWMCCYFLDCGVVVPDHINIKKEDLSKWISIYDQFFTEKKIETEFRIENLPLHAVETIKKEAARIANLTLC